MEESQIWLSTLLSQAGDSDLKGKMTEEQFLHALLYTFAVHIIDWTSTKWISEQEKRYWETHDSVQDRAQLLMACCGREERINTYGAQIYDHLSNLLDGVTKSLEDEEWLTLFDTLFYYIVSQRGFHRRHAQITAALATGLTPDSGLIDLQPYSGESIVTHNNLHRYRFEYGLVTTHSRVLDLIALRLAVRDIDAHLTHGQSDSLGPIGLALLDDPAHLSLPFSTLLQWLEQDIDTRRTLMVFRPSSTDKPNALEQLRQYLYAHDLLEAVIDFTSYGETGKKTRCCAWLLNKDKAHYRQTLCIDTRQLLEGTQGVGEEELAYFCAAVCEAWSFEKNSRSMQLPRIGLLGSLKGLFAQWFDDGYQNIDGVCTVLPSWQVIKGAVASNRLKAAAQKRDVSLLDRRPLERLLEQADCQSFCAYVIGNNGAGKSLLLASLIEDLQQRSIPSVAIVVGPIDRFPLSDHRKYPCYRYLGDRTNTGYSSQKIERRLMHLLVDVVGIPDRLALLENVLERLELKHRLYLAPKGAFNDLLQPLDLAGQVIPLARVLDENRSSSGLTLAFVRKKHSNLLKFTDLSSGEQQVLVLFAKIMASAGPGKVLLIDEPEVSLHVGWQQLLPGLFSQMAEQLQTRFVIATHSPTLIANAQDQLSHCFMAKENQLTEIASQQRHSVETILLKGFETYTPHNREIAERCAALVAEAIRATNTGEDAHFDVQQVGLDDALDKMTEIMRTSGDQQDKRYQQDRQLIEQARRAIQETFDLARQEFLA